MQRLYVLGLSSLKVTGIVSITLTFSPLSFAGFILGIFLTTLKAPLSSFLLPLLLCILASVILPFEVTTKITYVRPSIFASQHLLGSRIALFM